MTGAQAQLPDPRKSRAVLVGVSDYTTLEGLPGVENNIASLHEAMTDPELWGLPAENCVALLNPASPDEVLDVVHQAASEATDALLFYYAGHGLLDNRFELYLALPGADNDRLYRAVRYDDIRREVVGTALSCYGKVVLLDCCYSGRALQGGMGGSVDDLADQARVDGTYLMTATAETRKALAPPGERYTAFTGALVDKLTRGLPDGPALLDMETLFHHMKADLQARHFPVPQQRSRNDGRAIALVRNRWGMGSRAPVERPPIETRVVPRMPPGFETLLRCRPADMYAEVQALRARQQDELAQQVLAACAAARPDQEVAAIVGLLRRSGAFTDVSSVLTTAGSRSPDEVLRIVDALHDSDLPGEAGILIREAGHGSVGDAAALAHLLQEDGRTGELVELLDAALDSAQASSSLIDLVNALWVAGLREEVDSLIERTVTKLPASTVLALADELRSVGREETAFGLYAASAEAVVSRPPDVVAQLCHAMIEAGRVSEGDRLAQAAIDSTTEGRGFLEVALAFWGIGQEDTADRALARAAEVLPNADVITLVAELRTRGLDDAAHRFCLRGMVSRSAQSIEEIIAALRDEGWPVLAKELLEGTAAQASPGTVVDLLRLCSTGDRQRVLRVASEREQQDLAELMKGLALAHPAIARELADRIMTKFTTGNAMVPVIFRGLDSQAKEQMLTSIVETGDGAGLVALLNGLSTADAKLLVFLIVLAGPAKFSSVERELADDPAGSRELALGLLLGQPVTRLAALVKGLLAAPNGKYYVDAILSEVAEPGRELPVIVQEVAFLFDEAEGMVGRLLLHKALSGRSANDLAGFVQALRIEDRPVVLAAVAAWVKETYDKVGATDGILRQIGLQEYASRRTLFGRRVKSEHFEA
ncbi:caspase family protein [Amycolatopsis japonica]|uniref:caspase, EACC1-associated type n=1 Tax=Amycolatopsis japonica TaxID=208439 RepID=UPI0037BA32C9